MVFAAESDFFMSAVHTALQINPSDLIPKCDPATLRKRLFSPQKRAVARVAAIERQPERNEPEAFVERIWAHRFGPPTSEFLEWKCNPPLGYLKMRCREEGTSYEALTSKDRSVRQYLIRKKLVIEFKERYRLTASALGRLFKRDHSSIRDILQSAGMHDDNSREDDYAERAKNVVSLFNEGFRVKEIVEKLNYPQSRVSGILDQHFPDRPKPRKMADYAEEIREAFDLGLTYTEIGLDLGVDPSVISKFIKRMGWKRP